MYSSIPTLGLGCSDHRNILFHLCGPYVRLSGVPVPSVDVRFSPPESSLVWTTVQLEPKDRRFPPLLFKQQIWWARRNQIYKNRGGFKYDFDLGLRRPKKTKQKIPSQNEIEGPTS